MKKIPKLDKTLSLHVSLKFMAQMPSLWKQMDSNILLLYHLEVYYIFHIIYIDVFSLICIIFQRDFIN